MSYFHLFSYMSSQTLQLIFLCVMIRSSSLLTTRSSHLPGNSPGLQGKDFHCRHVAVFGRAPQTEEAEGLLTSSGNVTHFSGGEKPWAG